MNIGSAQVKINSSNCFKAYDIRGELGKDLDTSVVYKIGRSFAQVLKVGKVVIGRDNRTSSPSLSNSIVTALLDEGVQVLDLGMCGTEEMYFGTAYFEADGGIQVTASHNPINFNGMKLVGRGSRPLNTETEFNKIKEISQNDTSKAKLYSGSYKEIGTIAREAYVKKVLSFVSFANFKKFKVLVNFGNGAAAPTFDAITKKLEANSVFIDFVKVNEEPDGTFPNGVPNPLLIQNHFSTGQQVINNKADFGIAFDGDFDRCFFFDDQGNFINGEYIVGLLAEYFLEKEKGLRIVHDYRVIWSIKDSISRNSGISTLCNTGHVFIKAAMRENDAIYGGEISAHHYFKEFFSCDSGMIPWLLVLEILSRNKNKMSTLIKKKAQTFPSSGERNFIVNNSEVILKRIEKHFSRDQIEFDYNDGLSVTAKNWRFNIRTSKTEKLLRLNIESCGNSNIIDEKLNELIALIESD